MSSSKSKKSMNPLIFCPKIIDIQPKYVSDCYLRPIWAYNKLIMIKHFYQLIGVWITPNDVYFRFRHINMIVYGCVEGILIIFIFSRFFHLFWSKILQKSCISWYTRLHHNCDLLYFWRIFDQNTWKNREKMKIIKIPSTHP